MKSPKIMVAILAASTLGLASAAIAETQVPEGSTGNRQGTAGDAEKFRQRRGERSQPGDTERRSARQQRRGGREDRVVHGDAGEVHQAGRSRTVRDGDDGQDYRHNEGRRTTDGRGNREGYERWAERHNSTRHARIHDGRHNDDMSHRGFRHPRGDRRESAYAERRFGDYGRARHNAFDNRVDRRLSNQRARIRHGWEKGDLTRNELKRLRKDQHKIARMDRRFGSDGRYTTHERRKLNNALDRASHRVSRARNNDRIPHTSRAHRRGW